MIALSAKPDDPSLRSEVIKSVICLCYNTTLLKQSDRHFLANISYLKYSKEKFVDLLNQVGLTPDFDLAIDYLNTVQGSGTYPNDIIDTTKFSIEKGYSVIIPTELKEKINEHKTRMSNVEEWKTSDLDIIP